MFKIIFSKNLKQVQRDWLMLFLTLFCAPFFIFLYKMIFLEGMTVYNVVVCTELEENSSSIKFINDLNSKKYPGGGRLFSVSSADSIDLGIKEIVNHNAKILVNFKDYNSIEIIGDYSDPYFVLSSNLIEKSLYEYFDVYNNSQVKLNIVKQPVGISRDKKEFENYIPGLFIFSVLIQLYLFTLFLLREKESGIYTRYRLCGLSRQSYLLANCGIFSIISLIGLLITTSTAYLLGFQSPQSVIQDILLTVLICFVLNLSVIGVSFIISSVTKSIIHGLLFATFPFMVMVFFSGSVYPFPPLEIFKLIPATHAVNILHKLLTFGTPFADLIREFLIMLLESLFLIIVGVKFVKF